MLNNEQRSIVGAKYLDQADFEHLQPFIKLLTTFRYHFAGSPDKSLEELAALRGVNCQYLVHELLGWMFDVNIPSSYLSKEIFETDNTDPYFAQIDLSQLENVQSGDILLFENSMHINRPDYGAEYLHTALVIGLSDEIKEPLCIHALSFQDKTRQPVVIWSLSDFAKSKYHQKLVAIRRPRKLQTNQKI